MNKLLVICGPTATGKTKTALYLAKQLAGEIVSADSRQVYQGMDIGTGKDLPLGVKFRTQKGKTGGYYETAGVKIWGYDLVSPKDSFSVGQYVKTVGSIIKDIWKRNKLPILVGGTGLYIKAVTDGIPTAFIPQNLNLRDQLENKKVDELFESLAQLDPIKAGSMNLSDKKNPRRLIRAIEIATWKLGHAKSKSTDLPASKSSIFFIGFMAEKDILGARIEKRIKERVEKGIKKEIRKLLRMGVDWQDQAMISLGYKEWQGYFTGKESQKETLAKWLQEEKKYAKRQMTWFKKDKRINWFNSSDIDYKKKVEKMVRKWYSTKKNG